MPARADRGRARPSTSRRVMRSPIAGGIGPDEQRSAVDDRLQPGDTLSLARFRCSDRCKACSKRWCRCRRGQCRPSRRCERSPEARQKPLGPRSPVHRRRSRPPASRPRRSAPSGWPSTPASRSSPYRSRHRARRHRASWSPPSAGPRLIPLPFVLSGAFEASTCPMRRVLRAPARKTGGACH